jgi:hypothetical protein
MTTRSVNFPYEIFRDSNGEPLENGSIYIGVANLDPVTNPIAVYWDAALTIPAAQPIPTINGYPSRGGSPGVIYADSAYSMLVRDKRGAMIISDPQVDHPIYSADTVYYRQPLTGAVTLPISSKAGESVSLLDFGAVGDGITDDREAIQAAIDATSAAEVTLVIPPRTYVLTAGDAQTGAAAEPVYACLNMRSNMHIAAAPGAVFKLADGQSSNGAPRNCPMFFTNEYLHDITITGLTIDQNGSNNPINNIAHTFAHVLCSGAISGVIAGATRVLIDKCKFLNTPGATCVGMGQNEATSGTISTDWTVTNNLFYNNGLGCYDHSSIYALADRVICTGNIFRSDTMAGLYGGQCSYEVHGADQVFANNIVGNYYQGLWVATNKVSVADNILITGNTLSPVSDYGVAVYRESAPETAIRKVSITNNVIGLSDRATAASFKAGVAITSRYPVDKFLIAGNIVSKVGTTEASALLLIAQQDTATATPHNGIVCSGNFTDGLTHGVFMTTGVNGIGEVIITDNVFRNLVVAGAESETRGIYLERLSGVSEVQRIHISGNRFINDSGAAMTYGIRLQSGVVNDLYLGPDNSYSNVTTNYVEGVTVTTRRGYYPKKAYTPVVTMGTPVTISDGVLEGEYAYRGGWVDVRLYYKIGAGDTVTGGLVSATMPVAAIAGKRYFGTWEIDDVSAGLTYYGTALIIGTDGQLRASTGGVVDSGGVPVSLAVGDVVSIHVTYQANGGEA